MAGLDRLLIVDDDPEMHRLLHAHLANEGYDLTCAERAQQALDLLASDEFAVAILDLMLPGMSGVDMLKQLQDDPPRTQIIVLTAYASLKTAVETLRLGACDYIAKPFYGDVIKLSVRRAIEKYRLQHRLDAVETMCREMALSHDTQQAARSTLEIVRRVFEIPACWLWALDETGVALYQPVEGADSARLDLDGDGAVPNAVRGRRPVNIAVAASKPDGMDGRSELVVPLEVDGRVIGALAVSSPQPDAFGADDETLLSTLATQAAVALESARRYEQAQREIVERRRAEAALRASEERFRLLYEQAPLGYQALDEEGRLLQVNQAWVDLLGYTPDEVVGGPFVDLLAPTSAERFEGCFARLKAEGTISCVELELMRRDGAWIKVSFDGRIGADGGGAFRQAGCILRDVTGQS